MYLPPFLLFDNRITQNFLRGKIFSKIFFFLFAQTSFVAHRTKNIATMILRRLVDKIVGLVGEDKGKGKDTFHFAPGYRTHLQTDKNVSPLINHSLLLLLLLVLVSFLSSFFLSRSSSI